MIHMIIRDALCLYKRITQRCRLCEIERYSAEDCQINEV